MFKAARTKAGFHSQGYDSLLLENGTDGVVLFDLKGYIAACNPAFAFILGYDQETIPGTTIHSLSRGDAREVLKKHLEGLMILGFLAFEMELFGKRRVGTGIPVEATVAWIEHEGLFKMVARDLTIKKRLEEYRKTYSERLSREVQERTSQMMQFQEKVQRQKATLEGIIQGSPIPTFVLDKDHRITHWNKACETLTGFSAREMIGTNRQWEPFYRTNRKIIADLVMEGNTKELYELYGGMNLRKSQLVEAAYEAEHFFPQLGPNGTHLFVTAAPIKDESGAIHGAIVTYQDFTEKANLMEELTRREAYLNNLIQNSIDGIIATDDKGFIVIFNRSAQEILGYLPEEIIDVMRYQDILPEETGKALRGAFYGKEYGPPGKIVDMITSLLNKDREPIPVRFSGTLIYDGEKEVGSVVFIQDLRELQKLQREKAQAERMAAIGKTVADVAHYIKNVLSGLKGGSYVVKSAISKGNLDLVLKGWGMVEKNLDALGQIVADMLIYAGERRPVKVHHDPEELVSEILDLMGERARIAGVELVREFREKTGMVAMDRTAIHRSLLNLVGNAIDACTLKGITGGEATVKIIIDRPEGWAIRFQVIDSGAGMDEETQQKLFTDFFTTKGYAGTGLGLPVTRKMVEDHGGKLLFDSEPGMGTTFSLLLP
ncbi:MAG: PAS domain S-box protein [Desulfobacteraceae bacterium]|jgi:PAS domain S-box-containing protein|nr:MAG: PAS domain S-box protein [Desulfobacteraceae bacterium]